MLAKSELYAGNVFIRINQSASGVVRYITRIVDWTGQDLEVLEQEDKKNISMQ